MEKRDKSKYGECIIRSTITEAQWLTSPPSADATRPPSCPRCREAAWRGARLRIVSHGLRPKSQLGPKDPFHAVLGRPSRVVLARRYRCGSRGCGAVMLVVPSSVAPRLHYSACAVALALSMWAKSDGEGARGRESAGEPKRTSQGPEGSRRQIHRWLKAIRQRRVFQGLSCVVSALDSALAQAKSVVQCLAGWAPAGVSVHSSLFVQAFYGAAQLS